MMTLAELEQLRALFERIDRNEMLAVDERLAFSNLVDLARRMNVFPTAILAFLTELSLQSLLVAKKELAAVLPGEDSPPPIA